jgi:hypothetical protein
MAYIHDEFDYMPLLTPFTFMSDIVPGKKAGVFVKVHATVAYCLVHDGRKETTDICIVPRGTMCRIYKVGAGGDIPYIPVRASIGG